MWCIIRIWWVSMLRPTGLTEGWAPWGPLGSVSRTSRLAVRPRTWRTAAPLLTDANAVVYTDTTSKSDKDRETPSSRFPKFSRVHVCGVWEGGREERRKGERKKERAATKVWIVRDPRAWRNGIRGFYRIQPTLSIQIWELSFTNCFWTWNQNFLLGLTLKLGLFVREFLYRSEFILCLGIDLVIGNWLCSVDFTIRNKFMLRLILWFEIEFMLREWFCV